jgi:death-on-curing protein
MVATGNEPLWLSAGQVQAIHDAMLAQHGGLPGLRDAGGLESVLGRPMHRWHYRKATGLADLAASYGFALAKDHPFADGNKRTAFVSMATFFEQNGHVLTAPEPDVVHVMIGVASGEISERQLAGWLKKNSEKYSPHRR